jgi:hypothetical protein
VITKERSPLLAKIKEPSPSENPMNHSKNSLLGSVLLG